MSAPADRPSPVPTSGAAARIGRRPSDSRDQPFLRELFAQSRDDLLLLTPDTRDVVLDMRFRAHRRRLRLEHPRAQHEVLVCDGVPVGRLVLDDTCSPEAPELRIVDLAVSADRRGEGIGSAALASVVEQAEVTGRAVRLLAWTGEAGVRRFYLAHGFTTATAGGDLVHVRPAR